MTLNYEPRDRNRHAWTDLRLIYCAILRKDIRIYKGLTSVRGYLEHVCVVVMAVLHHHRLVPRQSEGDAVLPAAVDGLRQKQRQEVMPSS